MFKVQFELDILSANSSSISGFDFGHIIICENSKCFSSKEKKTNQAMMIFLSIIELLDGISRFSNTIKQKKYEFVAVDSSFSIIFQKEKNNSVQVFVEEQKLNKVLMSDLLSILETSTNNFMKNNFKKLSIDDPIYEDLQTSFNEFQKLCQKK